MHCSCFVLPFTKPEALHSSRYRLFTYCCKKQRKKLQIKSGFFFQGLPCPLVCMWEVRRCTLPPSSSTVPFSCAIGHLSSAYLQLILRIIVAKYPLDLDFVITLFMPQLRQLRLHVKSIACFNGAENKEILQKHGGPL